MCFRGGAPGEHRGGRDVPGRQSRSRPSARRHPSSSSYSNVVPYRKGRQRPDPAPTPSPSLRYAIVVVDKEKKGVAPPRYLSSLRRNPGDFEHKMDRRRCLEVFMSPDSAIRRSKQIVESVDVVVVDFPPLLAECKTSGLDVLLTSKDENVTYVFSAIDTPCEEIRQRMTDSFAS